MKSKKGYQVNYLSNDEKYLYFDVVNKDTNVYTMVKLERVLDVKTLKKIWNESNGT